MRKSFFILLAIARHGGLSRFVSFSTVELAAELGVSQQSASRLLRDCEKQEYVTKSSGPAGTKVLLTDKGTGVLKAVYRELALALFPSSKKRLLEGVVASGFGEGKYYLSQEGYRKQLLDKFGFEAFKGTLNVKVDPALLESFLAGLPVETLAGFETPERSFGHARCYRVSVRNQPCVLVIPSRGRRPDGVVELVAGFSFRKKLGFADGGKIIIEASG